MSNIFRRLSESSRFQNVVTFAIVFAGVLVGLETDAALVARHEAIFHFLDQAVLGVFIAEIVIKVLALGRRPWRYFADGWNVFDFMIVAAALLPIGGQHVVVLRLLRLLRVLRLVRAVPRLQILVTALIKSLPSMAYVSLLLGLLFYVYAVAGTFLFGVNDPVYFGSLSTSLLTLFRIVTLEGWTEILYIEMRGCAAFGYSDLPGLCTTSIPQPTTAVIYFTSFILLGTMIVLNLFIGVIMNGMTEASAEEQRGREANAPGSTPELAQEFAQMEVRLAELQLQIARLRAAAVKSSLAHPAATTEVPERAAG